MEMQIITTQIFTCPCSIEKKHQLLMDGGMMGNYVLKLCVHCEAKQNKEFLIKNFD